MMKKFQGAIPKHKRLYWAYGSNLNIEQMLLRCPRAEPFVPLTMRKAVLRFRLFADVAVHATESCPGALWWITPQCERMLDAYEGVNSRLYEKRYFRVRVRGERVERSVLYYKMLERGVMPPSEHYLDVIAQGYQDFDLPLDVLDRAVRHSWADKNRTPRLSKRYVTKGEPILANAVDYNVY